MGDHNEELPKSVFIHHDSHKSYLVCLDTGRIIGWIIVAEMPPVGKCANSESLIRQTQLRGSSVISPLLHSSACQKF